jgi:hypothetical protein
MPSEQAVIVHLKLSDREFGTSAEREAIHKLSSDLERAIAQSGAGEFDGDEFSEGVCLLFMYAKDADRLLAAVEHILRASAISKGGWVIKRYGRADDPKASHGRISL